MTLPALPSSAPSREGLRVGGGYNAPAAGASPAGGLDIDGAGHLATNGDVTVGGTLFAARAGDLPLAGSLYSLPGGCDKTWSRFVGAGEMVKTDGTLAQRLVLNGSNVILPAIAFGPDAHEYAGCCIGMPPDYNGGALRFNLLWTVQDGSAGDVIWNHRLNAVRHDETLNITTSGYGTLAGAFVAVRDLHDTAFTATPLGADPGDTLVTALVGRRGAEVGDTFGSTAYLLGFRVSYA
jgi:hypothetical protein